jgi:nucleotide-binding universal stress UspA family protein
LDTDDLWPRLSRYWPVSILSEVRPANETRLLARARRVLLAQDLTPAFQAASQLAEAIARRSDAVLDVVTVIDGFREIFHRNNRALVQDPDRYLTAVRAALDVRVGSSRTRGVRCVGTLLVGAPALELARHAAFTGADLMVLTSPQVSARLAGSLRWRALSLWPGARH